MFSCKVLQGACALADPAWNTVRVNLPVDDHASQASEKDRLAEEQAARERAEEEEEARQVAEETRRQQLKAKEAARLHVEAEAEVRSRHQAEMREKLLVEALEREREDEAARLQEERVQRNTLQREIEEQQRAEAVREAEAERLRCERREVLANFLAEHKFKTATTAKKSMMSTTFPIHHAAKLANEQIVGVLLQEGVDPLQKNSSGKTALQVAQKLDKKGSHVGVLRVLGGA